MSEETRALFYRAYNSALNALDEEEYGQLLEQIKLPEVLVFDVKCYPVLSETIKTIFDGKHRSSMLFAMLYKGWPIDSKANPTKVAAIFRQEQGSSSTCSGALVPCHIIDESGLIPQLSEEEFVNAPAPGKWGRAEELAQDARLCASGTAYAEDLQLPTAPVPQMRGKGVATASTGGAENPERIIDSSKKPKPTTGKQPDARSQSIACHKAKKAKPSVKPDEISLVEFDAFMASLKKTLFESTVPTAKYTEMKQERDELLSRTAALEKRCADAEELLEGFNSSLSSLQATWTAKAKAFTDAQDS